MSSGPVGEKIKEILTRELAPSVLEINNDSHKHAHHTAMRGSTNVTESHFRLVVVSDKFAGKSLPQRHRMIYSLLDQELKRENGVHALQMKTKTPEEYQKQGTA